MSSGYRSESLLQPIDLEPSSKHAATATLDITSDTGVQLGQTAPKFEEFLDHYGDGFWRCNDIPVISDGGADEPKETPKVMILVGTNNISRTSDEEEAQWESMMVCLFTTLSIRDSTARY